jgi:hypothetical protein
MEHLEQARRHVAEGELRRWPTPATTRGAPHYREGDAVILQRDYLIGSILFLIIGDAGIRSGALRALGMIGGPLGYTLAVVIASRI